MGKQAREIYNQVNQLARISAEAQRRAEELLEGLPLETVAEIYVHASKKSRKPRAGNKGAR
jgi:hypothetical protein